MCESNYWNTWIENIDFAKIPWDICWALADVNRSTSVYVVEDAVRGSAKYGSGKHLSSNGKWRHRYLTDVTICSSGRLNCITACLGLLIGGSLEFMIMKMFAWIIIHFKTNDCWVLSPSDNHKRTRLVFKRGPVGLPHRGEVDFVKGIYKVTMWAVITV